VWKFLGSGAEKIISEFWFEVVKKAGFVAGLFFLLNFESRGLRLHQLDRLRVAVELLSDQMF
jgi:hypothetical protein